MLLNAINDAPWRDGSYVLVTKKDESFQRRLMPPKYAGGGRGVEGAADGGHGIVRMGYVINLP